MLNANGLPQQLLVVGGGSDLAVAIIKRLATDGPLERVALAGPRPASLERARDQLRELLDDVATFHLDLASPMTVPSDLEPALEWLGNLDAVLVAAGVLPDQHAAEADPSIVANAFEVNATGPAVALSVLADRLERAGTGQLIILSSVAATVVRRRSYVYDASKAALDRFALGLADRLEPAVGVHIVRPMFVTTRMTEGLERPPLALSPEQVAAATIAGIQARRRVIWVPKVAALGVMVLSVLPRTLLRRLPI